MKKTTIINALEATGLSDTNKLFNLDSLTLQRVTKGDLEKISEDTVTSLKKQLMEIEMKLYKDEYDKYCITRLSEQIKAAEQVMAERKTALA